MKLSMKKLVSLVLAIIICQFAGILGAFFTTPAIASWYVTLTKPSFSPPNWLFAPVWTTLYLLMGITLYLLWQAKKSKKRQQALKFFFAQLIMNSLWSILFFGLHSPSLAFVEILLLLTLIALTFVKTQLVSKKAALLLVPYLLWVSFATILNLAIVLLN